MRIYRHLDEVPTASNPVVATIGNFDGVHLGHRGVIAEVIARARQLGGQSLAITFDPHPSRILQPANPTPLITPTKRKLELLAETGIDATLVLSFTSALRHMHPRQFAAGILVDQLRVTEIHEGENFRFGYHAEAGVDRAHSGSASLEALGEELGFRTVVYAPRSLRGAPVSSSRIRALLAQGDVSHARALLGRPFSIDSTPAPGRGYGSRYVVPTINLAPYTELLPAHGVYISSLTVGSGQDKETFQSVTNVGNRPTFGPDSFAVESHLLNFHPLEGPQALTESTPLRLTFLRRLREERAFASTQELRDQIGHDVERARSYFSLCRTLPD